MKIEILGDGCSKCIKLKQHVEQAVAELDTEATVEAVMDPETIARYQARSLPVLVVDGAVQPSSSSLSVAQVKALLTKPR